MRLAVKNRQKQRFDAAIPLINIVFLLLMFFIAAGTLAPPPDPQTTLISSPHGANTTLQRSPALRADGRLYLDGRPVEPETVVANARRTDGKAVDDAPTINLVVDRQAPANSLVEIAAQLRANGAGAVHVIVERNGP